jgi:hypothetical protein
LQKQQVMEWHVQPATARLHFQAPREIVADGKNNSDNQKNDHDEIISRKDNTNVPGTPEKRQMPIKDSVASANEARMVSDDGYEYVALNIEYVSPLYVQCTSRLRAIIMQRKLMLLCASHQQQTNLMLKEAQLAGIGPEFTYAVFHFHYNTDFVKQTFVDGNNSNHRQSSSTSTTTIINASPASPRPSFHEQNSIDILWLSPTVFISTHLYQFPSSVSSPLCMIELISRDSKTDAVIRVYTVDTDGDNNNIDNHPHHSTPALSVVCLFLQRLLASVPIDYFAQIKLWQPPRAPLPPMAELRTFLSIIPPNATHLHQTVVSVPMDEITSFRLGGECDISVFKDLATMMMNHHVRLDMWSLHLPCQQLEEANTILRDMQNIPHITVPMGLNDFNSQDMSFTCNANLQSITVSLIDEDVISTTLLNGIKCNPQLVTFRLNMYGKNMQQNIQNLCCYALDGNTSLSRLVVYIDYDEDEDDDRESIDDSNNSRITVPFRPLDMLFTEVASCKNGWNMQCIHVTKAYGVLPASNEIYEKSVAPILSLNRYLHEKLQSESMSVANLSQTIARVNNGELLRKVSNQPVNNTIPSNASVIYHLLRNNVAVYDILN